RIAPTQISGLSLSLILLSPRCRPPHTHRGKKRRGRTKEKLKDAGILDSFVFTRVFRLLFLLLLLADTNVIL
ncbi:unnamed protein product, partial [Musa acuminata subsp. burmannicoides]